MTVGKLWREMLGDDIELERDYDGLDISTPVGSACYRLIQATKTLVEGTKSYEGDADANEVLHITKRVMDVWYFG